MLLQTVLRETRERREGSCIRGVWTADAGKRSRVYDPLSHCVLHFLSCSLHCKICYFSLGAKKDTLIIIVCFPQR